MAMTEVSRRPFLAYALVAVGALLVGYLLTSPMELLSFTGLLGVASLLLLPLILRWHHAFLICSWHMAMIVFFLPGEPPLWMLAVAISLPLGLLGSVLNPRAPVLEARAVTTTLLLLALVVVATGFLRGGFGLKSLGSASQGGRAYFYVLFAILGYFALMVTPITPARAALYVGLFIFSHLSFMISHLIYLLGDKFYFLYAFFSVDVAASQIIADYSKPSMVRLGGLGPASFAVVCFLLMRYGIQGTFNPRHPFRFLAFVVFATLTLLSGFRSMLVTLAIFFLVQFYLERLFSSRILIFCLFAMVAGGAVLVPLASRLPLPLQRTLSILPLDVDPMVRSEAEGSSQWRVKMWRMLVPDLPKYVVAGKGYSINPSELALSEESMRRGYADDFETAVLVGNYHNGPLSVYVPFGSMGLVVFLLFLGFSVRLLYRYYRQGDPALQRINTLFLSLFITQGFMFLFVFGALNAQLHGFTGIVGLSIALNRGARQASLEGSGPTGEEGSALRPGGSP
jgi:hypothetical protein